MSPPAHAIEITTENLHLRVTILEEAQKKISEKLDTIEKQLTQLLINTATHNAQACPQPGLCLVVQREMAQTRKDIDSCFLEMRDMQKEVQSLQRWQTGLMYVYTFSLVILGVYLKFGT